MKTIERGPTMITEVERCLILYTRPGCHLCEVAADLVAPHTSVRMVDIEDDLDLIRRYGNRVPVIRSPDTAAELGWPFDQTILQSWLRENHPAGIRDTGG